MAAAFYNKIQKTLNGFKAVHEIDLEVNDGEFVVLVGGPGLRQEHAAAHGRWAWRSISGGERIGDKVVNGCRPAARHRDGVPELRAVSAHEGLREPGLRPEAARAPKTEVDQRASDAACWRWSPARPLSHASSRAGNRSVSRWAAPSSEAEVFLFDEPLSNLDAKLRASDARAA